MPGGYGSRYKGAAPAKRPRGHAKQPRGVQAKGGFGSRYNAVASAPRPKKKGHHGIFGLVENLGSDVVHAVAGIPMGVVETVHHPVRAAKATVKSYKETYGPLTHGDVSKFLHNVYDHPLGPFMDLATIVTLGSGAAAKVGLLGAEANIARDLELRSGAQALGQEAKVVTKKTSTNPAIRARQVAVHNMLNKLPHHFSHLGETARYEREAGRPARQAALRRRAAMRGYTQAVKHLSAEEFSALHIIMNGVHPEDWIKVIQKQPQEHIQHEMLKVLDNPEILSLVDHPSAKIEKAIPAFRHLAEADKELKIAKGLDLEAAQARPGLHHRIASEELGREARGTGHEPAYVPDVAHVPKVANADFARMSGGIGLPKRPGSLRHNKGVLFKTGQLVLHPDLLGTEYLRTVKYSLHDDIHSELMAGAARIPKDAQLPEGWEYIRRPVVSKTGNRRAERIPPLVGSAGERGRSLQELIPDPEKPDLELTTKKHEDAAELHDHYLIVPSRLAKQMGGEFTRSNSVIRNFIQKPTTVWRALVLGLRPGFLINNVVGNHLLYAIHAAGVDGLRAYLNAVKREHGTGMVRTLLNDRKLAPALREKFIDEFFPEQGHAGTFGVTNRPTSKTVRAGKKGVLGVLPATQAAAETVPRRALVETFIRKSPEFRKVWKEMPKQTREFEAAAAKIIRGEGGDAFQRQITEKVNNVLGDFTNLSEFERNTMRGLFPFYSWYRAITRIATHLALDTPGRANLLTKIGNVGVAATEAQLGALPEWLQGLIPVGDQRGDEHGVLKTTGFNPFETLVPLAQGIGGILTGAPGETGKAASELGPNPFALALIEHMAGKDFFTNRELKGGGGLGLGALRSVGAGTPEWQLLQGLRGHAPETKTYQQQDARQALLQFLGIPLRELNVRQAHRYTQTA